MTPAVGPAGLSCTWAGNLKSMIFCGEGLFLAGLSGTGTVYLQNLCRGSFGKDEGSILGGLGNILMGGRQ